MRLRTFAVLAVVSLIGGAGLARASIIFDQPVDITGAGFGNIPRLLTVQSTADNPTESGCVAWTSSGMVVGASACLTADATNGNGVLNIGGDEPPPTTSGSNKFAAPTLGDLGITQASDLRIVFDATQPGGGAIDMTDLTLKFFDASGSLLLAIDGERSFSSTTAGNGRADFAFKISDDELASVQAAMGTGVHVALESSFTGAHGGPESFFITSVTSLTSGDAGGQGGPGAVPEPSTWLTLGAGLIGLALWRRSARRA